ncbi:coenzyme A transporter [Ascoidea rubescens DSM 1968]|uniref:Mitochondrial carrier n=1 Tax=Ascoidea rubescens DSM 1968 TaxID=1344418 RepID=A0A1D2VQ55_9ASCO|nr:mitochondrial carrier [Ascoidea rubescens DSM 1968]ODV63738.1 mitochondrial carrier [Ascoidea rubescens DSM 1968]
MSDLIPSTPVNPSNLTQNDIIKTKLSKTNKIKDKNSLEYVYKTAIAGGISGSCAKTIIAPLDRVKILFQTANPEYKQFSGSFFGLFKASNKIYFNDGLIGFFQGHSATLLRIFPYAAIKWVFYEQIRNILIPNDNYETNIRRLLSGSLSGMISVFATYPLDLLRVRLAFETKKIHYNPSQNQIDPINQLNQIGFKNNHRLISTVKLILKEHPPLATSHNPFLKLFNVILPNQLACLSNFYRGFTPTILGMIPYAGVSFWTYDLCHDIFRSHLFAPYTVQNPVMKNIENKIEEEKLIYPHYEKKPLKSWAQLLAGGLAGLASQTAAYPLEVIRRRMQVGAITTSNGEFMTIKQTAKLIWHGSGIKGFYVGLSIGYLKVTPMVACSFLVYEKCKMFFGL